MLFNYEWFSAGRWTRDWVVEMKYCDACGEEAQNTMVMCAKCGNRGFSDMPVTAASQTNTAPQTPNTPPPNTAPQTSPAASQVASSDVPAGWLSTPPTPWRRYAARTLDIVTIGFGSVYLAFVILRNIAPYTSNNLARSFEGPGGQVLDAVISIFLASIVCGAIIGVSGSSVGKLIFGIMVLDKNNNKIGLSNGIKRDLKVYVRGFGFGIPLVSLVTLIVAFNNLKKNNSTSWDSDDDYQVWHRPSGPGQYVLNTLGIILFFIASAVISII